MVAVSGGSAAGTTRVDGQFSQPSAASKLPQQKQHEKPDRNVRRINGQRIRFADLARFAWPTKTEANLAFFLKVDPRTVRRWLADDNEPPADALGVVLAEIMKRFHQR